MTEPEQRRAWYRGELWGWGFFYALALVDGHWRPMLIGSAIGLALGILKHGWPWTWGKR